MIYTEYYNMKKPERNDCYNVDDFNANADIIDAELKKRVCVVTGRYQGNGDSGLARPTNIDLGIKGGLIRIDIIRDGYGFGQNTTNGPGSISIDAREIIEDWSAEYVVYDDDYAINARLRKEGDVIKSVGIICQDQLADSALKARVQMNELGTWYSYTVYYIGA